MDRQTALPCRTDDLEGLDGRIKSEPEDFAVEEIPLYEPEDDGQHVYVKLTRTGMTTRNVVGELADLFDVDEETIGYAGLKDKVARSTQTFSLDSAEFDRPKPSDDEVADQIDEAMDVEVEFARRHRNKLRRGHLIGNRFRILVREVGGAEAVDRARAIADALVERGVPNFYGAQRFGDDGDNAERGREIIERGGDFDGPYWKRNLLCNAYQSALFNRWLTTRIDEDLFDQLLEGDVAKKTDTGGLFEVKDLAQEQPRFDDRDITFTGPIYGDDMWWAVSEAGDLEARILEEAEVTVDALGAVGLSGSRRRGRIHLDGIDVEETGEGLELQFALPKGAYATVVLREFLTE